MPHGNGLPRHAPRSFGVGEAFSCLPETPSRDSDILGSDEEMPAKTAAIVVVVLPRKGWQTVSAVAVTNWIRCLTNQTGLTVGWGFPAPFSHLEGFDQRCSHTPWREARSEQRLRNLEVQEGVSSVPKSSEVI